MTLLTAASSGERPAAACFHRGRPGPLSGALERPLTCERVSSNTRLQLSSSPGRALGAHSTATPSEPPHSTQPLAQSHSQADASANVFIAHDWKHWTGLVLEIQAAFESPGKTIEGKQISLISVSPVTSQVRLNSKYLIYVHFDVIFS